MRTWLSLGFPGVLWLLYLMRESLLFQLCLIQFMNELIKLKAHDLSESIEVSRATPCSDFIVYFLKTAFAKIITF